MQLEETSPGIPLPSMMTAGHNKEEVRISGRKGFKCSSMKTKLQMFEDIGRLTLLNIIYSIHVSKHTPWGTP